MKTAFYLMVTMIMACLNCVTAGPVDADTINRAEALKPLKLTNRDEYVSKVARLCEKSIMVSRAGTSSDIRSNARVVLKIVKDALVDQHDLCSSLEGVIAQSSLVQCMLGAVVEVPETDLQLQGIESAAEYILPFRTFASSGSPDIDVDNASANVPSVPLAKEKTIEGRYQPTFAQREHLRRLDERKRYRPRVLSELKACDKELANVAKVLVFSGVLTDEDFNKFAIDKALPVELRDFVRERVTIKRDLKRRLQQESISR